MPLPRLKLARINKPRRVKSRTMVWLLEQLDKLPAHWCEGGEVINLPGWKTIKYKETEHDVTIIAEVTTEIEGTCTCGETAANFKPWGFTELMHVLDMPIRNKRTRIYFRLRRKRCNNPVKHKRKTLQQSVLGVDERHSLTARLAEQIESESFNIFRSFSDIADETGVHELIVRKLFTRRAKLLEDEAKRLREEGLYETPEWIGIDEVYPRRNQPQRRNKIALCVVSAPALQQVIGLLRVNQEKELFRFLLRLPNRENVKAVTMDMCKEFRCVVRKLFPKARIVVDRYHVHNLLNVAIKAVLDVLRAVMTYTEIRENMRPETLLLKSYRRLSIKRKEGKNGKEQPCEKEVVDKWLADMPDLKRAHDLKERFSDILQLTDRNRAEGLTDLWLPDVKAFAEEFEAKYHRKYQGEWAYPFANVPDTISQWRDSILNYIDCKQMFNSKTVSNSFAEFANGRIRAAYEIGYYSFEVLRLKVIYGGVLVRRRPPHPLYVPRLRVLKGGGGQKKGEREVNPNANLQVLKRLLEEADETRGLLPRPQEVPGYASRFNLAEMEAVRQEAADKELQEKERQAQAARETEQQPASEVEQASIRDGGRRGRIKYNPDQQKLF